MIGQISPIISPFSKGLTFLNSKNTLDYPAKNQKSAPYNKRNLINKSYYLADFGFKNTLNHRERKTKKKCLILWTLFEIYKTLFGRLGELMMKWEILDGSV